MAVAVLLTAACGGSDLVLPGPGEPGTMSIRVVDGDGQSGEVGALLTAPVVVEVTDAKGEPVEGATVMFELTDAATGAAIAPPSATTDALGRAEAQVLLGSEAGLQTGEARVVVDVAAPPKVSFSALAVASGPPNRPPRAEFDWHCLDLVCQFNDASTDEDGSVSGWSWNFGDAQTSSEREPSHIYSQPGTYAVTLTVTDDGGLTDESSRQVQVTAPPPAPNEAPHADFEVHCSGLTCAFVDKSEDQDGTIVSWQWSFGDGGTSDQRNPIHTYAGKGRYDVLLTVTDNAGAADIKDRRADARD